MNAISASLKSLIAISLAKASSLAGSVRTRFTNRIAITALACVLAAVATANSAFAATKPTAPVVVIPGACQAGKPAKHFTVDLTGNASSTGRTFEGPLCVDVAFNPALQLTQIEAVSSASVKGPDLSAVILGGSPSGGLGSPTHQVDLGSIRSGTLPGTLVQIRTQADALKVALDAAKQAYVDALLQENKAIDQLSLMNKAMRLTTPDSVAGALKNQYLALKPDLQLALASTRNVWPTDVPNNNGDVLLSEAQGLEDRLAHLPLDFVSGKPKPAGTIACDQTDVDWADWYSACKDTYYTPLKQELDADLAEAQLYTSTSDAATALKKQVSIVQYWDKILTDTGLQTTMSAPQIQALSLNGLFVHLDVPCDGLFNESVSTTLNLVTLDYTPTLTGADPTQKVQSGFVTVNCSTRFTLSAGVGFSTIEQKTFAIVPGSDGKGGTTNIFGTTSDSRVTPIALAVTHVRLREWMNHGLGLYGSLGVGGNLQTNASAVYFLPGASVALWRTMYLTAGAGIGSHSELVGGYKVGDAVPTGVSAIGAVTGTSYSTRFAFALTFTKP